MHEPGSDLGGGWRPPTLSPAASQVTKDEAAALGEEIIEQVRSASVRSYPSGEWERSRTVGPTVLDGTCVFQTSAKAPLALEQRDLEELVPAFDGVMAAHGLPGVGKIEYLEGEPVLSSATDQVRVLLRGAVLSVEVAAHPDQCG